MALAAPARPVRAPCGTTGTPCAAGDPQHGGHLGGRARADHDRRHAVRAQVGLVALVAAQQVRVGQHGAVGQRRPQCLLKACLLKACLLKACLL